MKISRFFTSFLLLALIIIGGCIDQSNQPSSQAQVTTPPPGIPAAITPENLQFLDFHFTPIDPTDSRLIKAITRDQAVKSALEFEPLGKNATSISTQVGYFDNISAIDLQNHRLVWLVTYHGIDTVSSGPPGAEHHVAHTLAVAVDAYQGVGIVSMTLAVITPEPGASQTAAPALVGLRTPSLQVRETAIDIPSPTPEPPTTPIPNNAGLTIEENEIIGQVSIEPLTFLPVHGSQQNIIARHALDKGKPYSFPDGFEQNGAYVIYPVTGDSHFRAVRAIDSAKLVLQQDKVTILEIDAGDVSPISPLRGLWVDDEHWILETAYVKNINDGNSIYSNAVGQIYRDGVLLNEQFGYEEMFGFQLLDGEPFYFYKKEGQIYLSYNNEDLPVIYDEIPHYRCCSGAALNPIAGINWIGFWGQRDGVWYYTEIGRY